MLDGVRYYTAEKHVPNDPKLKAKVDCIIEMIAMYLHHKHPDKSFEECLPTIVLIGPSNTSSEIIVKYYINHNFMCEFEVEKLSKWNSDRYGLSCDLHERCLDADSNFEHYTGLICSTQEQQNLLGVDVSHCTDLTAIGKEWRT